MGDRAAQTQVFRTGMNTPIYRQNRLKRILCNPGANISNQKEKCTMDKTVSYMLYDRDTANLRKAPGWPDGFENHAAIACRLERHVEDLIEVRNISSAVMTVYLVLFHPLDHERIEAEMYLTGAAKDIHGDNAVVRWQADESEPGYYLIAGSKHRLGIIVDHALSALKAIQNARS
jgi:hypothetical protein